MPALYLLTFENGKRYIGATMGTLRRRRILHMHHARKGRKGALQAAIRKYGSFEMQTLVIANDWAYLCELERRAIVAFGTRAPNGYNMTDGGEGVQGVPKTAATRAKLSAALKGKGIGNQRAKGYRHSPEAKVKIAAAGTGRIFSEERRARIGATKVGNQYNLGRPRSAETREKISATQRGRKMPEDRRIKMIGRKAGPGTLLKMSLAFKGKPWSPARRAAQEARRQARASHSSS